MSVGTYLAASRACLLVVVGILALVMTTESAGQEAPASFGVTSLIRDFSRDHPDFNRVPADGFGYYAGAVDLALDADGKPVLIGNGNKLTSLWTTSAGQPIAPHLFNIRDFLAGTGGSGDGRVNFHLTVHEKIVVRKSSEIDSFDSNLGPYGGENVGSSAVVLINAAKKAVRVRGRSTIRGDVFIAGEGDLETVVRLDKNSVITGTIGGLEEPLDVPEVEPPQLGESVGDVKYKGGTHVISADLRCDKLKLEKGAVVEIEGDVTIHCETLEMRGGSEIRLRPESTLTLFVDEDVRVRDESLINTNTGNPQLVSILMLPAEEEEPAFPGDDDDDDDDDDDASEGEDHSRVRIEQRSSVVAWVQGPDAELNLENRAEFFGSFSGLKVKVEKQSRLHVDVAVTEGTGDGGPMGFFDETIGDIPGMLGVPSDEDITSAGTFAQWWRDVPGVNLSTLHTLTFTRNGFGVYECFDDDFRPIDGRLLGNEGDNHNYHFTLEVSADFTYEAGLGRFFEFRGTDDAYLFINGKLVLDLGGMGFNKVQRVDLDRLGLVDGEAAHLQFFYAQRQRGLGIFRVRTDLVLSPSGTVLLVLANFD